MNENAYQEKAMYAQKIGRKNLRSIPYELEWHKVFHCKYHSI